MRRMLIILLLLIFSTSAFAEAGKSAASFLRIGVGAKPSSLGEAYVGVSGDISSVYWNPAGLCGILNPELSFTHAFWFEDINYSNFVAGAPLLGGYTAFGMNALSVGEIKKYDKEGNPVNETYAPEDISAVLSYAKLIKNVSAGASVKFISSDIDGEKASAGTLDAGFLRDFRKFAIGFSIQNIGTEMKYIKESDPLPMIVRIGISYPFDVLDLKMLAVADANYSRDVPFKFNAGINADYFLNSFKFSIRIGAKSYAKGLDELSRLTAGFGIEHNNIGFDYAFASFEDLGITHRISLTYSFPTKKKEMVPSSRRGTGLKPVPAASIEQEKKLAPAMSTEQKKELMRKHFMKGNNLLMEKKYNEGIKEFEKVLELDPEHSLSKEKIKKTREWMKAEEEIDTEF